MGDSAGASCQELQQVKLATEYQELQETEILNPENKVNMGLNIQDLIHLFYMLNGKL